jgi:hypothetical protein
MLLGHGGWWQTSYVSDNESIGRKFSGVSPEMRNGADWDAQVISGEIVFGQAATPGGQVQESGWKGRAVAFGGEAKASVFHDRGRAASPPRPKSATCCGLQAGAHVLLGRQSESSENSAKLLRGHRML